METPNDIKPKFETRTILCSEIQHKYLTYMKIEGNYKNISEVLDVLIKSHQKLKVMNKAKEMKNGKTN